jgi:hypothetical protein
LPRLELEALPLVPDGARGFVLVGGLEAGAIALSTEGVIAIPIGTARSLTDFVVPLPKVFHVRLLLSR